MSARAIWKGQLCCGDMQLPVKFYSAAQDRNIHFRLLHDKDRQPLKQRMVSSRTGKPVAYEDIRKGYQISKQRFVVLQPEELEKLEPPASRAIDILHFIARDQISHLWYDRPYWLAPDGEEQHYFAFAEALAAEQSEGLARWTMRKKSYVGAVREQRGYLLMMTLRHSEEVILSSDLEPVSGRELAAKERKMASQLVDNLAEELDLSAYRDDYRDRVAAVIETKRRGEHVTAETYEEPEQTEELADALQASLEATKH